MACYGGRMTGMEVNGLVLWRWRNIGAMVEGAQVFYGREDNVLWRKNGWYGVNGLVLWRKEILAPW